MTQKITYVLMNNSLTLFKKKKYIYRIQIRFALNIPQTSLFHNVVCMPRSKLSFERKVGKHFPKNNHLILTKHELISE